MRRRSGEPVGQIVVVGIRVVEKSTLLTQQTAGVVTDPPGVLTHGAFAAQPFDGLDGAADVVALLVFGDLAVVEPAVTMSGDFVPGGT